MAETVKQYRAKGVIREDWSDNIEITAKKAGGKK
jgi:hypothetical protein